MSHTHTHTEPHVTRTTVVDVPVTHTTHTANVPHVDEHVTRNPADMPRAEVVDKEVPVLPSVRNYFVATLTVAILAMIFILAALLSPRWLENDDGGGDTRIVWSPLYQASACAQVDDAASSDTEDKRQAVLAMSFIEFFFAIAAMIASALVCCAMGRVPRIIAMVCAIIAFIFALIACAVGGSIVDDDEPGTRDAKLWWAFGLKVIEVIIALVLSILTALRFLGKLRPGAAIALLLATALVVLGLASLVGLGWEKREIAVGPLAGRDIRIGLWDFCLSEDDGCDESENKLDATLGLLAATVALLALYLILFVAAVPSKVLLPISVVSFILTIVAAIVFGVWADDDRCDGLSPRDANFDPDAGVGLFATGAVFELILIVLSVIRVVHKPRTPNAPA